MILSISRKSSIRFLANVIGCESTCIYYWPANGYQTLIWRAIGPRTTLKDAESFFDRAEDTSGAEQWLRT